MAKRPGTPSRAKGASKLPASAFIYKKKRKYPINTKKRARSALRLGAKKGTYGSPATIRRAVLKRYPSLRKRRTTKRRRRTNKRRR